MSSKSLGDLIKSGPVTPRSKAGEKGALVRRLSGQNFKYSLTSQLSDIAKILLRESKEAIK